MRDYVHRCSSNGEVRILNSMGVRLGGGGERMAIRDVERSEIVAEAKKGLKMQAATGKCCILCTLVLIWKESRFRSRDPSRHRMKLAPKLSQQSRSLRIDARDMKRPCPAKIRLKRARSRATSRMKPSCAVRPWRCLSANAAKNSEASLVIADLMAGPCMSAHPFRVQC